MGIHALQFAEPHGREEAPAHTRAALYRASSALLDRFISVSTSASPARRAARARAKGVVCGREDYEAECMFQTIVTEMRSVGAWARV